MIVGAYALDLYCDNKRTRDTIHEYDEFPHQIVAYDRRWAFLEAKQKGWRFRRDRCLCPKCKHVCWKDLEVNS